MKATTTQCSHGWHIEYLRRAETAAITTLLACEKDSHPFRDAMVAGAEKSARYGSVPYQGGGSMKVQRTAGPLGRAFGFVVDCGGLSVAFNAGWYVFSLRCRGLGFVQLALRPLQVEYHIVGWSL